MITPAEIRKLAKTLYATFLKEWLAGEVVEFPLRVRANLKLKQDDFAANLRDIEALRAKSKDTIGWGYRIEEQLVHSPVHGNNLRPVAIWIDTEDDLLRLSERRGAFHRLERRVMKLRNELPELEPWIQQNPHRLPSDWWELNGAIQVVKYLVKNPRPGCYPQQLPLEIDTKFINRHETMLRQWLNLLLPSSAIASHEDRFARRFGLRESQLTREVLLLDSALKAEIGLPFDEFAAPAHSLASLELKDAVVVIVENKAPLTCVPAFPRGLVLAGHGCSVHVLKDLPWLADNRVLYWGDIDAAGYEILSDFRLRVPHIESVLMDTATYEAHKKYAGKCKHPSQRELPHLTDQEQQMYQLCLEKQVRLEQEKLGQKFTCDAFFAATRPMEFGVDSPTVETKLSDAG